MASGILNTIPIIYSIFYLLNGDYIFYRDYLLGVIQGSHSYSDRPAMLGLSVS